MSNLKRTGRIFTAAALAASTTLTAPSFALAQQSEMRLAQATTEEVLPSADGTTPTVESPPLPPVDDENTATGDGADAGADTAAEGTADADVEVQGDATTTGEAAAETQADSATDDGTESGTEAAGAAETGVEVQADAPAGEDTGGAAAEGEAGITGTDTEVQADTNVEGDAVVTDDAAATGEAGAETGADTEVQSDTDVEAADEDQLIEGGVDALTDGNTDVQTDTNAEGDAAATDDATTDGEAEVEGDAVVTDDADAAVAADADVDTDTTGEGVEAEGAVDTDAAQQPQQELRTLQAPVDAETEGTEGETDAVQGETTGETAVEGETSTEGEEAGQPAVRSLRLAPAGQLDAGDETPAPPAAALPLKEPEPVPLEIQNAVDPSNLSATDSQVQTLDQNITINTLVNVEGEPREDEPEYVLPPDAEVVERVGDRDILTIVGAGLAGAAAGALAGYIVESNDDERLAIDADEVYYEDLPEGRIRETIVRPSGVQVVTISNEYGDIVQRSRIMPDGREIILFYDPYAGEQVRPTYYYDVGEDLPPIDLVIPEERYIVDVEEPSEELYYETLIAPPVETVERIYSVNEVRYSERIRAKVRRIDLNAINFGFGSATIPQEEVEDLQALADAIDRVLEENPGETFLIEGHTDAVGSEIANLALSDARAETVATALTEFFSIPPENLVTQGYGEQFLKVETQEPSRENRRVTLRRITPLVKPIQTVSAN